MPQAWGPSILSLDILRCPARAKHSWAQYCEGGLRQDQRPLSEGLCDGCILDSVLPRRRSQRGIIFFVNGIGPRFLRDGVLGTTYFSQ